MENDRDRILRPATDAEWYAFKDPTRCETPGCMARGTVRSRPETGTATTGVPLRDQLCICPGHYRMIAEGYVACWGEPPLGVVWRLGRGEHAMWFQNDRRLSFEAVACWLRGEAEAAD